MNHSNRRRNTVVAKRKDSRRSLLQLFQTFMLKTKRFIVHAGLLCYGFSERFASMHRWLSLHCLLNVNRPAWVDAARVDCPAEYRFLWLLQNQLRSSCQFPFPYPTLG